jgi:hypothetical protein
VGSCVDTLGKSFGLGAGHTTTYFSTWHLTWESAWGIGKEFIASHVGVYWYPKTQTLYGDHLAWPLVVGALLGKRREEPIVHLASSMSRVLLE